MAAFGVVALLVFRILDANHGFLFSRVDRRLELAFLEVISLHFFKFLVPFHLEFQLPIVHVVGVVGRNARATSNIRRESVLLAEQHPLVVSGQLPFESLPVFPV